MASDKRPKGTKPKAEWTKKDAADYRKKLRTNAILQLEREEGLKMPWDDHLLARDKKEIKKYAKKFAANLDAKRASKAPKHPKIDNKKIKAYDK